ncbi:substrate-binding domain-containing protein [Sporobolomyces salmoneus]|uniref:substrate-binding domain-containing protein n=1 Tax=Sporobolomyces salmoneus TaxID=183962 RepID=UPI0031774DCE
MSSTPKLRVGYVREHFSSPLLQLAEKDQSIELVECPSGTGQVMSRIKANEIDVAIALTESLLAGIAKKTAEFKLVGTYVTSPLQWAVIVGKDATKYQKLSDLKGEKIGISRIGSGSQVMASVMALNEGWTDADGKVSPIDFEVLDTFKALRDGVNNGKAAAFMWERFTTKPYLDEIRFIDFVPTPWHSWAVVASPSTLESSSPLRPVLESFLSNLTTSIRAFDSTEARSKDSVEFVKSTFGYPEEDVRAWFDQVSYPQGEVKEIERAMVEKTFKTLEAAGVLQEPAEGWTLDNFVDTSVAKFT